MLIMFVLGTLMGFENKKFHLLIITNSFLTKCCAICTSFLQAVEFIFFFTFSLVKNFYSFYLLLSLFIKIPLDKKTSLSCICMAAFEHIKDHTACLDIYSRLNCQIFSNNPNKKKKETILSLDRNPTKAGHTRLSCGIAFMCQMTLERKQIGRDFGIFPSNVMLANKGEEQKNKPRERERGIRKCFRTKNAYNIKTFIINVNIHKKEREVIIIRRTKSNVQPIYIFFFFFFTGRTESIDKYLIVIKLSTFLSHFQSPLYLLFSPPPPSPPPSTSPNKDILINNPTTKLKDKKFKKKSFQQI